MSSQVPASEASPWTKMTGYGGFERASAPPGLTTTSKTSKSSTNARAVIGAPMLRPRPHAVKRERRGHKVHWRGHDPDRRAHPRPPDPREGDVARRAARRRPPPNRRAPAHGERLH